MSASFGPPSGPQHVGLPSRGNRMLGRRRWDELVQQVANMHGGVPRQVMAQDREVWCSLEAPSDASPASAGACGATGTPHDVGVERSARERQRLSTRHIPLELTWINIELTSCMRTC